MEYIELTRQITRIYTLGVLLLPFQYAITDGFTGMGIFKYAFALSAWRKIIYFACVFLIPPAFGVRSIFYCEPLSDTIGPIVSIVVYLTLGQRLLRRLSPDRENG